MLTIKEAKELKATVALLREENNQLTKLTRANANMTREGAIGLMNFSTLVNTRYVQIEAALDAIRARLDALERRLP